MIVVRRSWLIVTCLLLALLCYYLPWYTHRTAGFTMNAFDLSEWSSLHPAVRSSSLLTSFLLRFPQVALVGAFALAANRPKDARKRWLVRLFAALLALRFVPPTEFFTSATHDPNYRQMVLLTGLGLGFVLLALVASRLPRRVQGGLLVGGLVAGCVAGWWGLSKTGVLMDNFEITVRIGFGPVGFTLAAFGAAFFALIPKEWIIRFLDAARVPMVEPMA